jgi:hypothetical protein
LIALIKPASNEDMIVNTIIIAIVETIGPIEFSTKPEKKKATDATVLILRKPYKYASKNLHKISS